MSSGFRTSFSFILPSLCLSFLLTSCTTDPTFDERSVEVRTFDLPPLDPSEGHYELWFSYPDDPVGGKRLAVQHGDALYVSMGKFTVDADGTVRGIGGGAPSFVVPSGYNPGLLADAILTVENPGDDDDVPSGRFLAGTFTGTESLGEAILTMGGFDAFGAAFDSTNLSGTYRLMTPSTAATDDENEGLWFVDLIGRASLGLRNHPINTENEGWTYESWLVRDVGGNLEYISLGTFDKADSLDANGAGPNAGPDPVPFEAPGEDFVQGTVRVLNDGTYNVLISLQPKELSMVRPFRPLLMGPPIPNGHDPIDAVQMTIAPGLPAVEITVDR